VSYVLLDADRIEVALRDGRRMPGKLVGLDIEVGVSVVRLVGQGPWPAAALGDSTRITAGDPVASMGMAEDGALMSVSGRVEEVRPFDAAWEYMLERAFIVCPYNSAFGGGLADQSGQVVGVLSLRLGEAPHVNLPIPVGQFLPGNNELLAGGRVARRRPRPGLACAP
jgi:S1-C subfamily serine protease